jgi:hypothetical protein
VDGTPSEALMLIREKIMSQQTVSAAQFEERLAAICLGGVGTAFPRRIRDRHVLYLSIVQGLDHARKYSEAELNDVLQQWRLSIGTCLDIDHVTLRRYLIDERYLSRDANGSMYQVNPSGNAAIEFEPSIAAIDPFMVIQAAKDRVAERKRQQSLRA